MEAQLFADKSPAERKAHLHANCDKIAEIGYMKKYSHEDLTEIKDELCDLQQEIIDIERSKKLAAKSFRDTLKPMYESRLEVVAKIKERSTYVKEDCYLMIDHDAGRAGYYNSEGSLIEERDIRPEERQTRIAFLQKTGTNDK